MAIGTIETVLPAGLDPVRVGRYGLWLMGLRSHRAAALRVPFPVRVKQRSFADRVAALLVPWRIHEYPGAYRFIGALCGVSKNTARGWLYGKPIPGKHAERLAAYLEQHASQCEALARELRAGIKPGRKKPHAVRGKCGNRAKSD